MISQQLEIPGLIHTPLSDGFNSLGEIVQIAMRTAGGIKKNRRIIDLTTQANYKRISRTFEKVTCLKTDWNGKNF